MMTAFFNYLLEVSVCMFALYSIYHFVMQQEKLFRLNRFYLLSMLILSISIPLINISMPSGAPVYLNDYTWTDGLITNTFPSKTEDKALTINWYLIFGIIYLIGVIIVFTRFLSSCVQISRLRKRGERVKKQGYILILTDKELPVFSFLNYVFLYKYHQYSEQESMVILAHEAAHINERHTIDLLLTEVVKMLLWFNPIVYIYQQKLKEVHEYLADEAVINTACTTVQYATLMMQEARKHTAHILPVTHFFHNQLKNRLVMLSKIKKPMRGLKTFLSLPVILMLFIAFSVNVDLFGQGDYPPNGEPGHCYSKCETLTGEEGAWVEVICPNDVTKTYMNVLRDRLKKNGYEIGLGAVLKKDSKYYTLDDVTLASLKKFQKDNKLPLARFSVLTMEALKMPTSK